MSSTENQSTKVFAFDYRGKEYRLVGDGSGALVYVQKSDLFGNKYWFPDWHNSDARAHVTRVMLDEFGVEMETTDSKASTD